MKINRYIIYILILILASGVIVFFLKNFFGSQNEDKNLTTNSRYPACDTDDVIIGSGNIWASCNVGSQISGFGEESYGYFFQWGRNRVFSSTGAIELIEGPISVSETKDKADFVTGIDGWWDNIDINLWGGSGTTNESGTYNDITLANQLLMQGPCSPGYHIPTAKEWCDLSRILGGGDKCGITYNNAVLTKLKIPLAGDRSFANGSRGYQKKLGEYWTSSTESRFVRSVAFYAKPIAFDPGYSTTSSMGFSVRCKKNF